MTKQTLLDALISLPAKATLNVSLDGGSILPVQSVKVTQNHDGKEFCLDFITEEEEVLGCPKCGHEWPAEDGPPCPSCGH